MNERFPQLAELEKLFPFAFASDFDGKLVFLGRSLSKIAPDMRAGEAFSERFELADPEGEATADRLRSLLSRRILVRMRGTDLVFRGQLLEHAETRIFFFAVSPYLTSAKQLLEHRLEQSDFAPHDSCFDLLSLLQTIRDALSDSKEMHQSITESERFLSRILDSIPDLISIKNADHSFLRVNAAYAQSLGLNPEKLIGKTEVDLGLADDPSGPGAVPGPQIDNHRLSGAAE